MAATELTPQATRRQRVRPIFAWLDQWGISRSWLARRLGISRARVWNYEHGVTEPPDWFIPNTLAALGVSAERIGLYDVPLNVTQRRTGRVA